MNFFTNFFTLGSTLCLRKIENGIRSKEKHEIKPSLYIHSEETTKYKNVKEENLEKIDFDGIREAKDFIKQYKESSFEVFGFPRFEYNAIHKLYPSDENGIEFDSSLINVMYLDIETTVNYGFPEVSNPKEEVTLISIIQGDKKYTIGTFPKPKESVFEYIECKDEFELFKRFIEIWKILDPDIVSGWNIEFFDLPYLFTRYERLFGTLDGFKKLSPWNMIESGESMDKYGNKQTTIEIRGVSVLDYMNLYIKFKSSNEESYKLDFIAELELKQKKIEYEGSFKDFYTNQPGLFVYYNQIDTELVSRMDNKLKLMNLVQTVSYIAKCNYCDVFMNTRVWDVIVANYLQNQNIHVVSDFFNGNAGGYEGAIVKETLVGKYDWICSFDVESLYPSLMIQYNISPDTMLPAQMFIELSPKDILSKTVKYSEAIKIARENNATLCANGAMFSKEKQGFIPFLVDSMFQKRKVAKKEMTSWKTKLQEVKKEIELRGL